MGFVITYKFANRIETDYIENNFFNKSGQWNTPNDVPLHVLACFSYTVLMITIFCTKIHISLKPIGTFLKRVVITSKKNFAYFSSYCIPYYVKATKIEKKRFKTLTSFICA